MKIAILFVVPFLSAVIIAVVALCISMLPFAFVILLVNMAFNRGRISFFIPKPLPKFLGKRFEKIVVPKF